MTYAEFLDWAEEDTLAEWVNGKIITTSPASLRHQLIAQFLARVLAGYVEVGAPGHRRERAIPDEVGAVGART